MLWCVTVRHGQEQLKWIPSPQTHRPQEAHNDGQWTHKAHTTTTATALHNKPTTTTLLKPMLSSMYPLRLFFPSCFSTPHEMLLSSMRTFHTSFSSPQHPFYSHCSTPKLHKHLFTPFSPLLHSLPPFLGPLLSYNYHCSYLLSFPTTIATVPLQALLSTTYLI